MLILQMPNGGTLTYMSRSDWGAGPLTRGHQVPESQFSGIFLHHTVIEDPWTPGVIESIIQYMKVLQASRPDLGSEVPYSWVVLEGATRKDVVVCEGRGPGRTGAHTKGYNSSNYGVAIGDDTRFEAVSEGMVLGIRWIGSRFLTGTQNATRKHSDVYATLCPGSGGDDIMGSIQPPFKTEEFETGGTIPPPPPVAIPPAVAPVPSPTPLLGAQYVNEGRLVLEWQIKMNALLNLRGIAGSIPESGRFDSTTLALTQSFQKASKIDDDGIVGKTTNGKMNAALVEGIKSRYGILVQVPA